MKKHLIAFLLLVGGGSSYCVAQDAAHKNVHTFVVDGELPAPTQKKDLQKGHAIAKYWADKESAGDVITSSWGNQPMYLPSQSIFFNCLTEAFAGHYSVILSPDIIWTVISQGFSHYVNLDPEAMRDRLVNHQGKMSLVVQSEYDIYSPEVKWEDILEGFDKQIAENTKGNIADVMRADFSTSGKTERISSQITLMSTVKSYFDFVMFYAACGIPSITIEGTPEDWKKVIEKTENLRNFDLGWWVDDLTPILQEFVKAAEGNPDRKFWQNIVIKTRPEDFESRRPCVQSSPAILNGWFLKLLPFNKDGRTPEEIMYDSEKMLPNVASAPFTYTVTDNSGNVISNTPMNMVSGLVGIDVDTTAHSMRPRIGWMVCESNKKLIEDQLTNDGILTVNSVPEELRNIEYLPSLCIQFNNEIKLPDWMDSLNIDIIQLAGRKVSPTLESELKRRFKDREIRCETYKEGSDNYQACIIKANKSMLPDDFVITNKMGWRLKGFEEPKFPDGSEAYYELINKKIKKLKCDSSTKMIVEFTIEKDGSITDIKVWNNPEVSKEIHEKVKRIFSQLPKWNPATIKNENGIKTPYRYRHIERVFLSNSSSKTDS